MPRIRNKYLFQESHFFSAALTLFLTVNERSKQRDRFLKSIPCTFGEEHKGGHSSQELLLGSSATSPPPTMAARWADSFALI